MTHPSTVADTLDAAADLLSKPGAWAQGAYGRSGGGEDLWTGHDPRAVCWCAFGAIEKITGEDMGDPLREAAARAIGLGPSWNDAPERTQSEVVAKLREAAAKARGEVQP